MRTGLRSGLLGTLLSALLFFGCSSTEPPGKEPAGSPPVRETAAPAPTPAPGPPALSDEGRRLASEILGAVVLREAGDPANAWALAHGLLALGPDFKARDGRPALRVLADDFLERDARGPVFAKEREGRPVEPHTDLVLKSLLEAGYGLEDELKPGVRLSDLLEASRRRLVVEGAGEGLRFPTPNDAPWSVQAWCEGTASGAPDSWPASGQVLRLEDITRALLAQLESETHFIRQAIAGGGSFQKRKQAIFRYTCGGAHLFQATASCAALGWPAQGNSAERVRNQVEIYLHRVPVETSMVDEALRAYPQLAILLHNQDLKFLGHLAESLGKVERSGLWTPTPQERLVLEDIQARAVATVIQLDRLGAYRPETMAKFSGNPDTFQLYLDLVGDAAHALHGLRIQGELAKSR